MSNTIARLIISPPAENKREAGIRWYEAQVDAEKQIARLTAYTAKDEKGGEAETRLYGKGKFTTTITEGGVTITLDAQVSRDGEGRVHVEGMLNGTSFSLVEGQDRTYSNGPPKFTAVDSAIIQRWGRLGDSCESLAQATRQSWGVVSCSLLYLGIGCAAAACTEAALPACGAAFVGGALAVENCLQ
ncbi:hypothetical protein [Mesorhizobium sp.]|uniref:hypothetical protein n=1 Tax=Mesorhizobium sp. TaxID=1871066 RepID=UPI00121DD09A|nr:hypothetical protein [Mesorhizobium sp.]TIS45805.1 MAG: hypothetical protein E5W96_29400 [Mesorhizobium sp.]